MMTYVIAKHSNATSEIARLLEARGVKIAMSIDVADVVILAVDSTEEFAQELAILGPAARKTIAIGPLPSISVTRRPEPGTLEGTLETFRPLGLFNGSSSDPLITVSGFLGPKDLAEKLGAGFIKAFSTRHYGSWIRRDGDDISDFISRLVLASAA